MRLVQLTTHAPRLGITFAQTSLGHIQRLPSSRNGTELRTAKYVSGKRVGTLTKDTRLTHRSHSSGEHFATSWRKIFLAGVRFAKMLAENAGTRRQRASLATDPRHLRVARASERPIARQLTYLGSPTDGWSHSSCYRDDGDKVYSVAYVRARAHTHTLICQCTEMFMVRRRRRR